MIKVAITDDHPLIIKGMSNLLFGNLEIELTQKFSLGKTTIDEIDPDKVDVLLLDFSLPDMDGEEICAKVKSMFHNINVLALTSFDETGIVKRMMQAGATGFVLKNVSDDVLVNAIKSVYNGTEYIQKELQDKLVSESISLSKQVGYLPKLTRREKEILKWILNEMTTAEIAEKLFLSPKTVETHRLNMMQKLNVKNTAGLVKLAISHNLV